MKRKSKQTIDSIPNLPIQLRKSLDTNGFIPISFLNGEKINIPARTQNMFLELYGKLKPVDREAMQADAIRSPAAFVDAIVAYTSVEIAPKSIYL